MQRTRVEGKRRRAPSVEQSRDEMKRRRELWLERPDGSPSLIAQHWSRLTSQDLRETRFSYALLARRIARRYEIPVNEAKRQVRDFARVARATSSRTHFRGKRMRRSGERVGTGMSEWSDLEREVFMRRIRHGRVFRAVEGAVTLAITAAGGLAGKPGSQDVPGGPANRPSGRPGGKNAQQEAPASKRKPKTRPAASPRNREGDA